MNVWNQIWDEAQQAAAQPGGVDWGALPAQIRADIARAQSPTVTLTPASGGGLDQTAALLAQLGVGVGAALVLLSPRWRRRIPAPLLLIAAAAAVAYIQTRARPASLALTLTHPTASAAAPDLGPLTGYQAAANQYFHDLTGL